MMKFGDLLSARQKIGLATFANLIRSTNNQSNLLTTVLAQTFSHALDRSTALCRWRAESYMETVEGTYGRQALPIVWDFAESVPISESTGSFIHAIGVVAQCVATAISVQNTSGTVQLADACESPLPDDSANIWFTDPPYYDAVPYADLSDFFLVWLKRTLPNHPLLNDPFDPSNPLSPKLREAVQDEIKQVNGRPKDRKFFEDIMAKAFAEGRRVLKDNGIGTVVFAHKTTEGWESLLSGMIRAGLVITGSWPIATEMANRLRARESAALATSVHLVCRPRPNNAPLGDWSAVSRELPRKVGDWMQRLQGEGVRGADLVFACIGPALEIYSRYSKVVDAEDREIPLGGDPEAREPHLRGYLAYVWEVVGRLALEQVLGAGETAGRSSVANALEEDSRLTALFLWTLQSTSAGVTPSTSEKQPSMTDDEPDEDGEETPKSKAKGGFSLPFDVVRRIAQPLGIHLPEWERRVINSEKGVITLLSVTERARQLLGEEGAQSFADSLERDPARPAQMSFFSEPESAPRVRVTRKSNKAAESVPAPRHEITTLDRLHTALLMQKSGQSNALRALLQAEQERSSDFLRLANALSALYPRECEEKRLLDAMLVNAGR